jgi:L-lactate dehydrogenase complex protein LldG
MDIGESQEQFVGRVREALTDRGAPVELPDDLEISRVIRADADIVARFLVSVEQAKMIPYRVTRAAEVAPLILRIAREAQVRSALVPQEDWPCRGDVCAALRADGVELLDPDGRDSGFVADIGITGVSMAIAETGSMVLTSGENRRRLASLAVPIHVGVVPAEKIVPDLLDWMGGANLPPGSQSPDAFASAVLVSGPSKTADIELTLVMGVHGPRVEHVIVVG